MSGADGIFLEGIQVEALIGVHAHEREAPQPLRLDLWIAADIAAAGRSDALADTIDYAEVVEQARRFAADSRYLLLEAFAADLCDALMARWPIAAMRLRVHKPDAAAALGCADVGITLMRTRPE